MSRPPEPGRGSTGHKIEQAIEKAFDPLATALKRATTPAKAAPGKPGLEISPLAVPFPVIPPIGGVEIATARAGFYKHERDDLVVFSFARGTTCAGVFTRHKIGSAPVDWCKRQLDAEGGGQDVRALVVNAGCANAFTGKAGADAARRTASEAAKRFGCRQRDVMLASTGVIGVVLDDRKIVARMPEIEAGLDPDGWARAGQAILTTDTFPKGAWTECEIEGRKVRIAGIAKGSGMIAPDMATMLAFIVTDAAIAPPVLRALLGLHVRTTFNSVTVDGDTSTNDSFILIATGQGNAKFESVTAPGWNEFKQAVIDVARELAQAIVRDGEGATKYIEIAVAGGRTHEECKAVGYAIGHSPLVKTAFFASDPNLGRILAAIGYAWNNDPALADLDDTKVKVWLGSGGNEILVSENGGRAASYQEEAGAAMMKPAEITIRVDLGRGSQAARVWTCDFSYDYVKINADYRS
ncbi:MAG: bifunctional glutamate N-acetyltransferase/amino-acid acetyltransferase ArgJ [Rhodocyclaceae bacterium]|nr:bifunctional glutamate N-acetyltransferase/amino-acid acetyltransferase ArgJ [Rhodocyclaceae bacterium]